MFQSFEQAPPDPILGLTEAFNSDPNPEKINLSVGVYKDSEGKTPVLVTVKAAEERILRDEQSKGYLGINGSPEYNEQVRRLMFGEDHEVVTSGRAVTAQTPGGTGALRVAGDFIRSMLPGSKIWVSNPTWPNHFGIFRAAGLQVETYPYFDAPTHRLDFNAMLNQLNQIPAGDVVVLHGCCHNPTGVDPDAEQWNQIADVIDARGLLPLLDFAYQGFAEGISEDALGLRTLCRKGKELLVCSSFSKNFGLYSERIGALTLVATSAAEAETALGHIKLRIRTNYSNPPLHGAAIVNTVLTDTELSAAWQEEVGQMRARIHQMRKLFVDTLAAKGVQRDFSFLTGQRGMFSFSGLTKDQVQTLRDQYSIYIVGSGRINVAGMTEHNIDRLCSAVAEVLQK